MEAFDESLRVLDLGRSDSEAVLGEAGDILGEGASDITRAEEKDLLGSTLGLGDTLAGGITRPGAGAPSSMTLRANSGTMNEALWTSEL